MTAKQLKSANLKNRILQLDGLALTLRAITDAVGCSQQYVSTVLRDAGKYRRAEHRTRPKSQENTNP